MDFTLCNLGEGGRFYFSAMEPCFTIRANAVLHVTEVRSWKPVLLDSTPPSQKGISLSVAEILMVYERGSVAFEWRRFD